ncbi:hypothetical protein RugamoR64_53990 [Duganella rhizosphaerae]|uniref:hypothetical protein n=1 Tax=Duganella rhizosphaerae TaxID=2885763 RepID=UPI0030E9D8CE
MKFNLASLGALVVCTLVVSHAAAYRDVSPVTVADKFVDALQHQRFKDAAAMFAPEATQNTGTTERALKRVDDSLGGFSTIHPVATLPDGKSIKLEVPVHKNVLFKVQKFVQVRYASTARDGQPVFYELNLSDDNMSAKVLSFRLHFPAADAQSTKRATQLVTVINR